MTEIRTPRLVLHRWFDDDPVALSEIHADPVVMQNIEDGKTRSLEQTAQDIEAVGGGAGRGGLRDVRGRAPGLR